MEIVIDTGALASLLGLCGLIGGILVWLFNLRTRFARLEQHDKANRELLTLLVGAQFAALDGLRQLGCNGEVTHARDRLKKHVIEH